MDAQNNMEMVFLTGGGGFIGSNLICALLEAGKKVVSLCLPQERPCLPLLLAKPEKLRVVRSAVGGMATLCPEEWDVLFIEADIRDRSGLWDFFKISLSMGFNYTYVIHLAACATIQQAADDEDAAWAVNVDGTANLLELLERYRDEWQKTRGGEAMSGLKGFIFSSTDKIYGEGGETPYEEDHPFAPEFPYEKSKAEADRMVRGAYLKSGIPSVAVRFCNVYGPGDRHICRLIPGSIYRLTKTGEPILLKMYRDGSGKLRGFRRDMIYVGDIVKAVMLLISRLEDYAADPSWQQRIPIYGEAFNLGTGHCYWVEEIVKMLWKLEGGSCLKDGGREGKTESCEETQFRPQIEIVSGGEIKEQCMSYQKAERAFGFRPGTELLEGLSETVEWYRRGGIWDERKD